MKRGPANRRIVRPCRSMLPCAGPLRGHAIAMAVVLICVFCVVRAHFKSYLELRGRGGPGSACVIGEYGRYAFAQGGGTATFAAGSSRHFGVNLRDRMSSRSCGALARRDAADGIGDEPSRPRLEDRGPFHALPAHVAVLPAHRG